MASAFGHAIVALAFGKAIPKTISSWPIILAGVVCTILPDADVIGFKWGIAYDSFWGHRGFSHSFLFAFLLASFLSILFSIRKFQWRRFTILLLFFFLCTASHALLDALTNGGLGVAFFSPWDDGRYFFPWRPIAVSPLGAARFFSERGLAVLKSEVVWVGIPSLVLWLVFAVTRRK